MMWEKLSKLFGHRSRDGDHGDDSMSPTDTSADSSIDGADRSTPAVTSRAVSPDPNWLIIPWAVVCSVEEKDLDDAALNSFAEFFAARINEQATLVSRPLHLEPMPVVCLRAKPTDKVQCVNAYRRLRDEYTSCIVVVHILPGQDTKDFHWMRALAANFGFVRQGVRLENVLSRFSNLPDGTSVSSAFANMSHWLAHSYYKMVVHPDSASPDGVRLRLTTKNEYFEPDEGEESAFEQETNRVEIKEKPIEAADLNYDIHINDITAAVWKTLHSYVDHSGFAMFAPLHHGSASRHCRSDAWIEVDGVPASASKWTLAAFFENLQYRVNHVYFPEFISPYSLKKTKARVCLGSRWEVVHACEHANKMPLFKGEHKLAIAAVHARAVDAINTAVKYDALTGDYKQYSTQEEFRKERQAA